MRGPTSCLPRVGDGTLGGKGAATPTLSLLPSFRASPSNHLHEIHLPLSAQSLLLGGGIIAARNDPIDVVGFTPGRHAP